MGTSCACQKDDNTTLLEHFKAMVLSGCIDKVSEREEVLFERVKFAENQSSKSNIGMVSFVSQYL